jgi:hypothetical protein
MRLWPALTFLFLASSAAFSQTPVAMDAYSTTQHLLAHPPIENPTAAGANPVYGMVNLAARIDVTGHVTHLETLNGPPELVGPATEAVRKWSYSPFQKDGKPIPVTTIITVSFLSPGQHEDAEVAAEYFPLLQACRAAMSTDDMGQRAAACTKVAAVADKFNSNSRYSERRLAFVYAAGATMSNKQFKEALDYANKAIAVVKQGKDDGAGASAAYEARAHAEAYLGDLSAADLDITMAEHLRRDALQQMKALHAPDYLLSDYVRTLKGMLDFHTQLLTAQGNTAAAESKTEEAAKLE